MTTIKRCILLTLLAAASCVSGFVPIQPSGTAVRRNKVNQPARLLAAKNTDTASNEHHDFSLPSYLGGAAAPLALLTALPAQAADTGFVLASAFVAYVHYAALLACVGVLVTERLLVKPEMTFDEEELLWKVDALYGIAGLALAVTGYYRAVEYGKGWEFYSHEPLFWVKLVLVGIWGASSFFPTITILKRVVEQRETGAYPPFSEKLAARMNQVINAELLALGAIPLTATLMSRGVLYGGGDFPWQLGAGLVVLTFGGFGFKYVKEALTWSEDEEVLIIEEE